MERCQFLLMVQKSIFKNHSVKTISVLYFRPKIWQLDTHVCCFWKAGLIIDISIYGDSQSAINAVTSWEEVLSCKKALKHKAMSGCNVGAMPGIAGYRDI